MNERSQKKRNLMYMFLAVLKLHNALVENKISNLGLHRSQHQMLLTIKYNDHICQKDLAGHLEISPAAAAVTLKKLESMGLVERCSSNDDNRMNTIVLTPSGEELVAKSGEFFTLVDNATFEGFTDEELVVFENLIEKMKKTLNKALKN